jgi:hypothetical protein
MKKEIPPAVTVVAIVVVVAVIGFLGYKLTLPPQKIIMSAQAIKGMKAHMMGQRAGASAPGSGGMGAQHSP